MYNVYVYYRLDPCHADAAETPIRTMMARLACRFGVTAQLLKKRDEPLLWMETYAGIADPASFERDLSKVADEYDVGIFLDGERHVECFHSEVT
ncbi:MAG: DUF4936 family protein [Thiobacillaceae bacterium]